MWNVWRFLKIYISLNAFRFDFKLITKMSFINFHLFFCTKRRHDYRQHSVCNLNDVMVVKKKEFYWKYSAAFLVWCDWKERNGWMRAPSGLIHFQYGTMYVCVTFYSWWEHQVINEGKKWGNSAKALKLIRNNSNQKKVLFFFRSKIFQNWKIRKFLMKLIKHYFNRSCFCSRFDYVYEGFIPSLPFLMSIERACNFL